MSDITGECANTVRAIDFNPIDGIQAHAHECELCLEPFKSDERTKSDDPYNQGNNGIPVMTATRGLIRVCRACQACGYVPVNLRNLRKLVYACGTVEVVEIHPGGQYVTNGQTIVNSTDMPQAWAIGVNGDNVLIEDVTDETLI